MYPCTDTLTQDIFKAINGQYSAIACYTKLAQIASTEEERKQILEIRKDEIAHYQVFSQIYLAITGTRPTPQITESCPSSYKDGLQSAFKDEQNTVDFYLDIAEKAQDPYIKEKFKRAAADEQNHAVWFLYYYTKLRC
ncbi:ferritin-like domain-containing protein [Desulfosporosinus sp. Sb-LF]|uniref:ferritin-like domain-containing protein n=1 Tax=Desulfosporosinus sp. Sb-LF TaxID=2560027 RepID=UPI00107F0B2F|nr:ferritin-like domain-containing protein [Desulfosporosinus sp. Sb-LF]TGE33405.1 ferritin-like domain-containing protein [Desulfosporosinus sp. Sb-LF]